MWMSSSTPASPRSAPAGRPATCCLLDSRLPLRRFSASSASRRSSARRPTRHFGSACSPAQRSSRLLLARHSSRPFARAASRFVERRIVAAIAHRIVGHGGLFVVGHRIVRTLSSQRPSATANQTSSQRLCRGSSESTSAQQSYANNNTAKKKIDQDHDHRGAKQFAPRRPRNLVHLSFDRNQKIRKRRHLHHAKAGPQPNHHTTPAEHSNAASAAWSTVVLAHAASTPSTTITASAPNVACRAIRPWFRLYNPKLKQLVNDRCHALSFIFH